MFFDFEAYFSALLTTDRQREELATLLSACVVWKEATPVFMKDYNGFDIHTHSGLTTYIPQERYPFLNDNYETLKWHQGISQ